MSEYLPQEIVINILKRLTIKTLLRCTSVCKAWYTLVTSSYFITTHLNFNKNNTPHLLTRRYTNRKAGPVKEKYVLYYDNETFDLYTKFKLPFEAIDGIFDIIGSCNGLICLYDYGMIYMDRIILWNPFINKAVFLPEPIYNAGLEDDSSQSSLALGFDFATNDYKLVRILHVDQSFYPKVEVCRLSTRIWEDISHLALPYYIVSSSAYVNGAAHWIGVAEDRKYSIVLFDMHSEVFREMMLPSSLETSVNYLGVSFLDCHRDSLLDCQGSLCLIHRVERGDPRFHIWFMKEYGAAESWIKRFSVNNSELWRPFCFRNNGKILWATKNGCPLSYDPQNKQMMDLDIRGIDRFQPMIYLYVGTYVESLVLLDRRVNFPDSDTFIIGSLVKCYEENHEFRSNILEVKEEEQGRQLASCKNNNVNQGGDVSIE